ncbi:MAG: Gfo/Idh/MocA family oxidoreductase [Pirellulales bacterium]|nr:Gfo/Idh/MocA family oxidoreductase [Pirellulales bacterium]
MPAAAAPLRVLVVGTGSIGERHVRCFLRTGRVELAICEAHAGRGREISERYQIPNVFDALEAALAWRPQAAVVATPADCHLEQALLLAREGVHLLIEKPLATSTDGVQELQQLVDERGLVAAVAYVLRHYAGLERLRQALLAGHCGEPRQLIAVAGQHFPTYRPAYREIYYRDHRTGGGAIQDALTHLVNAGEWLLGPVVRLAADADRMALEGVAVEDTVHLIARHGKVPAAYVLNQHQAPDELAFTLVGSHGTWRWEQHHLRIRWMAQPGTAWVEEPLPERQRDDMFIAQAHHFLDSIVYGTPVRCSLAEAAQTLRVNLAALRSVAQQKWQTIAESP